MNGLIAYDSSSDDDDNTQKNAPPRANDNKPMINTLAHAEPVSNENTSNRPILGPSIPAEITQDFPEYGDENAADPTSTERDMIRYLTQASHPMTEMPSSPPGSPDASATAKFKHFLSLKAKGVHFNEDLAKKSAFKNPTLLHTLKARAGLDSESSYRTSLPLNVLDVGAFPSLAYKENLLKSQQTIRANQDAEKKVLSATGKRKVEFTSGGISAASSATSSPGHLHTRQRM